MIDPQMCWENTLQGVVQLMLDFKIPIHHIYLAKSCRKRPPGQVISLSPLSGRSKSTKHPKLPVMTFSNNCVYEQQELELEAPKKVWFRHHVESTVHSVPRRPSNRAFQGKTENRGLRGLRLRSWLMGWWVTLGNILNFWLKHIETENSVSPLEFLIETSCDTMGEFPVQIFHASGLRNRKWWEHGNVATATTLVFNCNTDKDLTRIQENMGIQLQHKFSSLKMRE